MTHGLSADAQSKDRMTCEEWYVQNENVIHSRQLQYALWDWQNDRVELLKRIADLEKENDQLVELGEELHKTAQRYKIEMTKAINILREEIDDLQAETDRIKKGIINNSAEEEL